MNTCKLIYGLGSLTYLFLYYSGLSWIHPEENFSWPRFLFLGAMFILLDQYQLVPQVLTCPHLYPLYKVVAALIVANVTLVSFWWQMEDFLKWFLASFASLFQYVPMVNEKLEFGENETVVYGVQLLASVYFLLWVLASTGVFARLKGSSPQCPPATQAAATPMIRRRRSRSRC